MLFGLILLEYVCFLIYKWCLGELWHPGTVSNSTWTNDHLICFIKHADQFFSVLIGMRLSAREPRRVGPRCYTVMVVGTLIGCTSTVIWCINKLDEVKPGGEEKWRRETWEMLLLGILFFWLLGGTLFRYFMNHDYDLAWFFGKGVTGKENYEMVFAPDAPLYTKLENKDVEKSFFIKTRHPIWFNIKQVQTWLLAKHKELLPSSEKKVSETRQEKEAEQDDVAVATQKKHGGEEEALATSLPGRKVVPLGYTCAARKGENITIVSQSPP